MIEPCDLTDANREANFIKDPAGNDDCRGTGDVGVRPAAHVQRTLRAGFISNTGRNGRAWKAKQMKEIVDEFNDTVGKRKGDLGRLHFDESN